jgi:hypothetical protein
VLVLVALEVDDLVEVLVAEDVGEADGDRVTKVDAVDVMLSTLERVEVGVLLALLLGVAAAEDDRVTVPVAVAVCVAVAVRVATDVRVAEEEPEALLVLSGERVDEADLVALTLPVPDLDADVEAE